MGDRGPCTRAVRKLFARPADSAADVQKTTTFVGLNVTAGIIAGYAFATPYYDDAPWLLRGSCGVYLALSLAVLLCLACTKRLSVGLIGAAIGGGAVAMAVIDLVCTTAFVRVWSMFVIFCDTLLVLDAPEWMARALVACVVVHLTVTQMELSYRFGLFDIDGVAYDKAYHTDRTSCEQPPCATGRFNFGTYVLSAAVFCLDYYWTRGFAKGLRQEKQAMAESLVLAQAIAQCLADFDLEAAAAFAAKHSAALPAELNASFETLLANLESYRPYLPGELFPNSRRSSSHAGSRHPSLGKDEVGAPVPGLEGHRVALVFSDIRSSTALWEHSSSDAMERALNAHNNAIRAALAANEGYEVKTIGDAFMIAFEEPLSALRFGHDAQAALGAMVWPEGLTRPDADDGLPQLAVRMGIHYGEALVQRNALTGRYDYFGPTVNRAARVEPFGAPGAVTVTADVVAAVGGAAAVADEGFVVVPYAEERSGKGLAEPLALTALLPRGADERLEASVRDLAGAAGCAPREGFAAEASQSESSRPAAPLSVSDSFSESTSSPSQGVVSLGGRRVFSAAFAEAACVGVVQFAGFAVKDAGHARDRSGHAFEAARAEHRLQALHTAVEMTRGHVTSVVNGTAWVSWGLQMPCAQYVNESSRCMMLFRDSLLEAQGDGAALFRAGLVTGSTASAQLALAASSRQDRRFVTLLGPSVELASALCSDAAPCGAWVLAAAAEGSETADRHAQLEQARRAPQGVAGASWNVVVYELDLTALAHGRRARRMQTASISSLPFDRTEFEAT